MACVSYVLQIACLVFHRTCSCIHGGLQYCDHYFVLQYFSVFERSVAIEITHIWINATLQQKVYCLYIILTNSLRNKEVKRVNQGRTKHTKKGNTKTSLFCFFFKLAVQFGRVLYEVFHEFLSAFLLTSQILVVTFTSNDFIKRFHPSGVPLKWPDTAYLKEPHKLRRTESFADFRFVS